MGKERCGKGEGKELGGGQCGSVANMEGCRDWYGWVLWRTWTGIVPVMDRAGQGNGPGVGRVWTGFEVGTGVVTDMDRFCDRVCDGYGPVL